MTEADATTPAPQEPTEPTPEPVKAPPVSKPARPTRPARQGGPGGGRRPDRGRGRGGPRDDDNSGLSEVVVKIARCATVVKGGRRFSFGALVVVGDRQGKVGVGYGKSVEVPSAVEKGKKIATRAMTPVKLKSGTIPHRVIGRFGAAKVVMVPASAGTGVIAGASVRAVLELAGVHDILTKSYGSNTPKNLVRATFDGLMQLVSREEVERLRGVSLPA